MILAVGFYVIYLLYYIVDMKKWGREFILRIPWHIFLLETWAVISGYFKINTGINGIIALYMLLYIINYFLSYRIRTNIVAKVLILTILVFLIYIYTRVTFSLDYESMLTRYSSYVIMLLFCIISYIEIKSKIHFSKLINELEIIGKYYILFTIIFSLIRFGDNMYNTGIIYGYSHMQPNYFSVIAVILLIFGIWGNRTINKNRTILGTIIILFLILTLRRTYLMIIFAMVFPFILLNIKKLKRVILPIILCSIGVLCLLTNIASKRDKFSSVDVENEGRFIEYNLVNDLLYKENIILQGDGELFITRGKYNLQGKENRPIHTGHTELILGSGYIGLGLYVLIFIVLMITILCNKRVKRSPLFPLLLSFFIIYIILSLSGGQRSPSSWGIMIIFMFIYNFCNERKNCSYNTHVQ